MTYSEQKVTGVTKEEKRLGWGRLQGGNKNVQGGGMKEKEDLLKHCLKVL